MVVRDPVARTEMAEIPNVRLNLSNRPENVLLVRQALTGLAESIGLDPLELNDISTAVSEACNNVVLHAYRGKEGPLEVEVCAHPVGLCVTVRDHGCGIGSRAEAADGDGGGIGLPVIRALAHNVEFRERAGDGTEVRIEFATTNAGVLERPQDEQGSQPVTIAQEELADTVAITVAPASLARTVVARVLSALAARAQFSTDRISDMQRLTDALVDHAEDAISASHLSIAISVAPRSLELRIGPLRPGRAEELVLDSIVDGLGPILERLSDGHHVSPAGDSEMLALRLAQRR